jgi:hypothetical protein
MHNALGFTLLLATEATLETPLAIQIAATGGAKPAGAG